MAIPALPGNWDSFDASQKIAWFNANDVSVSDLQSAGVDQATLNFMLDNGYEPPEERLNQQVMDLLAQETEAQTGVRPRETVAAVTEPVAPVVTPEPTPTPTAAPVAETVATPTQIQQAVQDAAYVVAGEQGNELAYNDITIGGKDYAVLSPTDIVRKSDDQSGVPSGATKYEYVDPTTGTITEDVQVPTTALQTFAPIIGAAASVLLPGVGSAIGQALGVSPALGTAIANVGLQVAQGVPLQDALLTAGIQYGTPQVFTDPTVARAVSNIASAAATGQDVSKAAINTAVQIAGQTGLADFKPTGDAVTDSALASALTSATGAAATGGNVLQSAITGAVAGSQRAGTGTTTIPGVPASETAAPTLVQGGLGATPDVGMDTAAGALSGTDLIGRVEQDQAVGEYQAITQAATGAKQVTAQEAAAQELYPILESYQGENNTMYLRDIRTGKITQVLPQGAATQVAGGTVQFETPQVIGAVEALPANAKYQGVLYTSDPNGTLANTDVRTLNLNSLAISADRDPNIVPVGNLVVTQNADGSVTQRDKATGDTATFNAQGQLIDQAKSLYTRANETASALAGTAQAGLGELGAALSATAQQLGVNSQAAITAFQDIQKSGELIRPESVNRQAQDFVNDIYRVASDPNASAQDIGRAIASAALKYPAGAAAHLGVELIQELPQLLLPGGPVAQFMGSIALNAAESAGAQALQKIDELKVTNPNATPQELARMARQDAGVAGAVTAAISLIPGVNNALARTLIEPFLEGLEEGSIEYITNGDVNAAKGKAVLGAVIGGKTAAAINTGEQVAEAAQNQFGVSPIFTGSAPIATTPSASVTVTGTRLPSDLLGGGGADITPSNLGTLPTAAAPLVDFQIAASPAEAVQLATSTGGNAAVVISVNPSTNTSIVMQSNGKTSVLPTSQLTNGSLVVLPATVTAAPTGGLTGGAGTIASAATAPGFTGAVQPITTGAAAPTGGITGQALIDAALAANANLTSGIVLNNNNDGTSTILKTDGGVSVVPTLDTQTGSNLTTGTQVLVDTVNNTATDVATQIGTQTQTGTQTATDTATQTQTQTGTQTQTQTQPETTVSTQTQVTPVVNTEEPEPTPAPTPEPTPPPASPEQILLDQILTEQTTPEEVPTPPIEPVLPEPPVITPEVPEVIVEQPPVVINKPVYNPPPGTRVVETEGILPMRMQLSEDYTGDVEGTPEEEQQAVWNVRSLKLRRLLGI